MTNRLQHECRSSGQKSARECMSKNIEEARRTAGCPEVFCPGHPTSRTAPRDARRAALFSAPPRAMRQRFRREGSCFRRLRSGVRRVKPSSWNGRGRERTREGARENAERGRGRQRERARPFGPGPVQAQPRALGAAWARLRTRTAKALWLPVRLGARARLSASVTAAPSRSRDREGGREHCRAELWAPRRA
ncbi:unnamed protein product [Prorocentrum cordatum]|uniref:Uncharacterized protein n=2 Tax=Prorocentrum cordatum TaxID=2364126 RepID=A0ABN9TGS7_9DINO|nr:unnamed protein product [Polarella glacialis]